MLFYLNDVEEGGETFFPTLGVQVVPKKGRALLWYGVKGMSLPHEKNYRLVLPKIQRKNPYALHAPVPVRKGEKWIAAYFFHDIPETLPNKS